MTALLLSLLATLPAYADDDPEPPVKKGLAVRLVAKKTTYKLDLGGMKKEDFIAAAKAGSISPPSVDLELVITNHTKEPVRIRTTSSTNRLTLEVKGAGAIDTQIMGAFAKVKVAYTVLQPKEKLTIPITRLASVGRQLKGGGTEKYHYWTEPGEYKVSASLYTLVSENFNGKAVKGGYQTLESKPITLKVEK